MVKGQDHSHVHPSNWGGSSSVSGAVGSYMSRLPWIRHRYPVVEKTCTDWQVSNNNFPKGINKVCHYKLLL